MKIRTVSELVFLNAINDPGSVVRFDLSNFPMFFDVKSGWETSRKAIDLHLIYFCRSGCFRACVSGKEWMVQPGELVWVQPGVDFAFYASDRHTAQIARFRLGLESRSRVSLRLRKPVIRLTETGTARTWLDQIRFYANASGAYSRLGQRAAIAGFLATALEADAQAGKENQGGRLTVAQSARLEHFVEMRGQKACSSADLAAHLQLAHGYFNRIFRSRFHRPARAWLIEKRIHAAAQQLIESNRNISEVAADFGYGSVYFFSRQFKNVMGVSPRAFKQKILGQ